LNGPMQAATNWRLSSWQMLQAQGRILVAIMLRDVRTRFFGSALGFLIAIGWPLSHIFILLVINTAVGKAAPYGDSAALCRTAASINGLQAARQMTSASY
jgi:capsular polysaccharide transport system permease protein